LLRYANVFDGNRQEQETDALSEVVSVARMDDKVLRAFAVE
jgi:hypothetical protein